MTAIVCAKMAECRGGSGLGTRGFKDLASCKSSTKPWCRKIIDLPDTGATADSVDACTVALAAVDCAGKSIIPEDVESCVFKGQRGERAKCTEGAQCKSGSCGREGKFWGWPDPTHAGRAGECQHFDW